ncbi:MAG: bile acid:sodium symporter family protein [Rhodospirillales bacterium]|nr:bile acid:sodium symporter family protein [Rhodospirillales bacterium]
MNDVLVNVVLPLVLSVMMFTMGLTLTVEDFVRVGKKPKAFFLGVFNQMLVLPIAVFIIATLSGLRPEFAVGFMILAACPGGITSNVMCYYARGDTALSISLTAIVSLVSFITLPLIVGYSISHFMSGEQAANFPMSRIAISLFVINVIPVSIGMATLHYFPKLATKIAPWFDRITVVLFIVIVVGAVKRNWDLVVANLGDLGGISLVICAVMLAVGFITARLMKLDKSQATTISMETGVQNAATAILIGGTILGSEFLYLPGAIYGVCMYLPAGILILGARYFINKKAVATV